jgi:hypothetical protein
VGDFPDTIDPHDLPNLNRALEVLLTILCHVRDAQKDNGNGRAAALIVLKATTAFI